MTRKLFWLFLLIGWPCLAWGQGGRFDSVAQKNVQNFLASIPGASIAVCPAGATGTPCSPLVPTSPVTLCTDVTCSTAAPNPFTADGSGNFGFYAIPGNYVYSITAPGVTGKLFNVVIPSVTPINLATQVTGTLPGANMAAVNLATSGNGGATGTLPGANYAAVNLAAGNVNGGATGTLPAANLPATTGQCTGVQFTRGQAAGGSENCATPPTFVASGASHAVGYVPDPGASAGTTHFLREDATWATVPAGGVSEMVLTTGWTGLGGGGAACNITTPALPSSCVVTVFPNAHTLVRFTYSLVTSPAGCTTSMVIGVRDMTTPANLTTVTLTNGLAVGFKDSGALSVAVTAGHAIAVGSITAPSGCSTPPEITGLSGLFQ